MIEADRDSSNSIDAWGLEYRQLKLTETVWTVSRRWSRRLEIIDAWNWSRQLGAESIDTWKPISPRAWPSLSTICWHAFLPMLRSRGLGLTRSEGGEGLCFTNIGFACSRLLSMLAPKKAHWANSGCWLSACSCCWHSRESFEALDKA